MVPKKHKEETDGPWQEVFEDFFQPFIELCFPQWAPLINWAKKPKALKGEFPSKDGKQICDFLFEIEMIDGQHEIIFCHLEIQGQRQKEFPFRIFEYNFAAFKKHGKPVVSVAILLDGSPSWRPNYFEQLDPFTKKPYHQFSFSTIKILDYKGREEELRKNNNVFSLVILAQLAVMESKNNQDLRQKKKTSLTRELFTSGLGKEVISKLYKFFDWLIKLDLEHMITFQKDIKETAERETWQDWDPVYVSTFEQVAMIKGREEGLQTGLQTGRQEGLRSVLDKQIRRRFPHDVTARHLQLINDADADTLSMWAENFVDAKNIEEVFSLTCLAH